MAPTADAAQEDAPPHAPSPAGLVVVSNRLPVRKVEEDGKQLWKTSPGGLVSALMPILHKQGANGYWIGWDGTTGSDLEPFVHEGIHNIPVSITEEILEGYYEGMANASIWPLYHDVIRPAVYRRVWWHEYVKANKLFADAAIECAPRGATVWVHDYHLHLVPEMVRAARPDVSIGFFLHIPFPGRGLFSQLPWRTQLLRGTLGADVVGFQTKYGAANFAELARRYAGAKRAPGGVDIDGRFVSIDAFPISIDTRHFEKLAKDPEVQKRAAEFRARLGDRKVLLGVDRMDYTKGIDVRLKAFQELLRSKRVKASDVVFIQSGVPTRDAIGDYADLRSRVEELVGQINGEFGEVGQVAVQYLRQNMSQAELVAMYLAADVMVVTPLRDGMNLVAKEFVATRLKGDGVVVLSEFTGAAEEFSQALVVNPHDTDGMVNALDQAIHMSPNQQKRRMRYLRKTIREHDVYKWAQSFLGAMADV